MNGGVKVCRDSNSVEFVMDRLGKVVLGARSLQEKEAMLSEMADLATAISDH